MIPVPFSFLGASKWPLGKDGPLLITTGNTVTLSAGVIKDYSSIQIDLGGTLLIDGASSLTPTIVGCRGPILVNGVIRSNTGIPSGGIVSNTNPLGEVISHTITQSLGGVGGTSNYGPFYGGASPGAGTGGYGGGGAGGGVNNGPGPGGNGGSNNGNGSLGSSGSGTIGLGGITLGNGNNGSGKNGGHGGGSGGGAAAAGGLAIAGGGAGGGMKGLHGVPLELYCKSTITGSGSINIGGTNGFNGGVGGSANPVSDDGGGCGGGGAGGSGGKLKVRYRTSFTVSYSIVGGSGGAGGIGSSSAASGGSGVAGIAGSVGVADIASL